MSKKACDEAMDAMLFGARQSNSIGVETLQLYMQNVDRSHLLDAADTDFTLLSKPMRIDELHFAVGVHKYGGLIKRINIALSRGKKNGEINRILNQSRWSANEA